MAIAPDSIEQGKIQIGDFLADYMEKAKLKDITKKCLYNT